MTDSPIQPDTVDEPPAADRHRFAFPWPAWLVITAVVALPFVWSRKADRDSIAAYPNRPIELVVPFTPGGGTDTFARIIKKAIEDNQLLPQPLVIINVDGAGATIGSRRVKDSEPDGYTAMILHDAIVTAKFSGKVDYGPEEFEPIAGTGEVGMVITVVENSKYKNLQDLMEDARQRPGTVSFGANLGALTHFAGLQLEKEHPGARFLFAQIGGGAKRFSDLTGGHIDVTGFSIEEFVRFRPAGLRGLAYFGSDRHLAAPDVPTAREQDYDIISSNTFYWWFPKGTSQDKVDTIATALENAMQTDYVKRRMAEIHCDPIYITAEPLRARIAATYQAISNIVGRPVTTLPNLPAILTAAIAVLTLSIFLTSGIRSRRFAIPAHESTADPQNTRPSDDRTELSDNAATAVSLHTLRPDLVVSCVLLTMAYVAAMGSGWIDFRPATVTFVLAMGLCLTRWSWRSLLALTSIAYGMSFGLHFLFTQVFVVDLP